MSGDFFPKDGRVLVVAEIGNNHEGDFAIAKRLVREARAAGADGVKLQTFKTESFVRPSDVQRFKQLKRYELSPESVAELSQLAHSLGMRFLSTALDLGSVDLLEPLVDGYKIASGDNDFYPLIARIAETGRPIIVSTGASDLEQVKRTVQFVRAEWARRDHRGELAVLHCVSSYPTPPEEASLRSIPFLIEKLGIIIGYSDHTVGGDACVLAVALGARIVEKHFTLDKNFSDFRDHKLSADPDDLRALIQRIRRAELLLGEYDKRIQACERVLLPVIRRAIVAAAALPAGHRLTAGDLTWLRPAGALHPGDEALLIGRVLRRSVAAGEALGASDAE